MDDDKIVDLYWERSEQAISESQKKYGRYCHYIAYNILYSNEDAEECVNDTYLRAWNTMPPKRPQLLSAFLGKITRNLALDRYSYNNAKKRVGETLTLIEEFGECLPSGNSDSIIDEIVLKDAINGFLESLTQKTRTVFMQRYWYLRKISDIANDFGMSESNVKVILHRTRLRFKKYLEKEGITI